ncbi:hypothetical protein LQU92_06895 [Kocuria sp. LUK]|uniref:hypothetical protein n=1 Tax=Kocuria sp. LUK TaxID=2897828 RepID=UPI001E4E67E7|nr:hypothetical protein [Kocuria sp. LUK]MCD1144969.1 hypothetical protein [Kocuria sp. LUK]
MDDDALGADQARRLHRGLRTAGLGAQALWLHYARLGGTVHLLEVEAYLHYSLALPARQRDLLDRALAELAADLQVPTLPFADDHPAGPSGEPDSGRTGGPLRSEPEGGSRRDQGRGRRDRGENALESGPA